LLREVKQNLVEISDRYLLESGPGDPAFNMALDEALLHAMPRLEKPVLRFYDWTEPAASFGYFQKFAEVEQTTLLRPLVRRPTGGGIVPHDADWTYSLVFPVKEPWYALAAIESYSRVHEWIQAAFADLNVPTELAPSSRRAGPGQCFVGHEQLDLLWHGKKIAGAAQRRTREGLLVQGSVQPPPIGLSRGDWEKAMVEVARAKEQINWLKSLPREDLWTQARALAREKYSQATYNQKR
jgi:lipoate-protein ligase A